MPSTGTASYTISRNGMITSSLRLLRVLQEGQTPSAQMLLDGTEVLEMLIKQLQSKGLWIWCYQLVQIPMVIDKNFYTIGPVSADVIMPRPLRLFDGSFIRDLTCSGQTMTPIDTPLRLISRLEYLQFGSKFSPGVPNSIYWDAKIDTNSNLTSPSTGHGTLFVYVNPSQDTRVIYANFQRQLYDMTSGTDEFDLPSENFTMLRWQLAAMWADEFEVPEERIKRLVVMAEKYLNDALDWSTEWVPMQFTPDWTTARVERY